MARALIRAATVSAMLCLGASTAFSQELATVEAGVGYSWLHGSGQTIPSGVMASGAWRLLDRLQLLGEAGWHAEHETHALGSVDRDVRTLLAGVRLHVWSVAGAPVFTDVLVGWHRRYVHTRSDVEDPLFGTFDVATIVHSTAIEAGGGTTVWLSGRLGAEFLAHYRRPLHRSSGGELRIGGGFRVAF